MNIRRNLLLMIAVTTLASMSMQVLSITWQFNTCQGIPGGGSCLDIRSDSLQGICESQLALRPDKYTHLTRIWVYDTKPYQPRAYCFYHGQAYQFVSAVIDECLPGKVFDQATLSCISPKRPQCKVGNPIDVFNGVKTQKEVDYFTTINGNMKLMCVDITILEEDS